MLRKKYQRRISRSFVSGFLCFKYDLLDIVLHENSDLLMKFRKED